MFAVLACAMRVSKTLHPKPQTRNPTFLLLSLKRLPFLGSHSKASVVARYRIGLVVGLCEVVPSVQGSRLQFAAQGLGLKVWGVGFGEIGFSRFRTQGSGVQQLGLTF